MAAPNEREKIGLVLSGGGARGAAHLGVLKEIERLKIPIDYIVGTSMGAIIGGLYASGMSIDEIEQALAAINWSDVLKDSPGRTSLSYRRKREDDEFLVRSPLGVRDGRIQLPAGLLEGQKFFLLLKSLTLPVAHIKDFDQFSVPFRAVASDISTGKAVVISSGDLAVAMRASASIPSAFSPVKWQGKLLVDGGVADNLPVAVARSMGAEHLIVVDVSTPLSKQEKLVSILEITEQLTTIMTRANTEHSLRLLQPGDVLIVPDLGDISTTSFDRTIEAIDPGQKAAHDKWIELVKLSVSEIAYANYRSALPIPERQPATISFVRINNHSGLSDDVIKARIHIPLGEALDVSALEKQIGTLYGMDIFQHVSYELIEQEGRQGVQINVHEKPWGPGYLQGGLSFHSQWAGDSEFVLGMAYTLTEINALGGEWRSILEFGGSPRIFTEFYQPLDANSRYFINPRLQARRITVGLFEQGDHIADYEMSEFMIGLDAGRELGSWGEIRVGWEYAIGDFELEIGDELLPETDFDSGKLFLRLGVDTLDNRYFATRGRRATVQYSASREALGGDADFDQLGMEWFAAHSYGKNTLLLKGALGTTLDDNAPVYGRYTLGGFLNLSGYDQHELSGQHKMLLVAGGMRRLLDYEYLPVYAGISLEAGNTWEKQSDIGEDLRWSGSVFLGIDTFIGPFYVGYSAAEHDHQTLFMYLGAPF